MIVLVTGPPGAGKSYYAIRKVADAIERGKCVATNVELAPDWAERIARRNPVRWLIPGRRQAIAREYRRRVCVSQDLEELLSIRLAGRGEGRGVMVLDEAHSWLNSRLWSSEDRLRLVRFFSRHRKLGWDVYLITQSADMIDKQVRVLFEYHVHLRNLRKARLFGVPVSPVNLFVAIWAWHAAGGARLKTEVYLLGWQRRLYNTYQVLFEADEEVEGDLVLPRPTG